MSSNLKDKAASFGVGALECAIGAGIVGVVTGVAGAGATIVTIRDGVVDAGPVSTVVTGVGSAVVAVGVVAIAAIAAIAAITGAVADGKNTSPSVKQAGRIVGFGLPLFCGIWAGSVSYDRNEKTRPVEPPPHEQVQMTGPVIDSCLSPEIQAQIKDALLNKGVRLTCALG